MDTTVARVEPGQLTIDNCSPAYRNGFRWQTGFAFANKTVVCLSLVDCENLVDLDQSVFHSLEQFYFSGFDFDEFDGELNIDGLIEFLNTHSNSIKRLFIENCVAIPVSIFEVFARLPLTHLDLFHQCFVGEEKEFARDLDVILQSKTLTSLKLNCDNVCIARTLFYNCKHSMVTELALQNVVIGQQLIEAICRFPAIRKLKISIDKCAIYDAHLLRIIQKTDQLQTFSLEIAGNYLPVITADGISNCIKFWMLKPDFSSIPRKFDIYVRGLKRSAELEKTIDIFRAKNKTNRFNFIE